MIAGFEWDPAKRELNLSKRGIDFARAIEIFDGVVTQRPDTRQHYGEPRIVATGEWNGRVLTIVYTVVYTVRGAKLRIISAEGQ